MLSILIKLVKIGKGIAFYMLGYSFLIKPPEYSNIIRIPIRIFEYQFWYLLPSLMKTALQKDSIEERTSYDDEL